MWKQGAEADIAQMAEHLFCTQSVAGSRPAIGSMQKLPSAFVLSR